MKWNWDMQEEERGALPELRVRVGFEAGPGPERIAGKAGTGGQIGSQMGSRAWTRRGLNQLSMARLGGLGWGQS